MNNFRCKNLGVSVVVKAWCVCIGKKKDLKKFACNIYIRTLYPTQMHFQLLVLNAFQDSE